MPASDTNPANKSTTLGPRTPGRSAARLFLGLRGNRETGQGPVLNAYDKASGEIVHAVDLPVSLNGTPMTYMDEGR